MRPLLLLLFLSFVATDVTAQVTYDTLSTRAVGPGMTHTYMIVREAPWTINVLEADLTNPYVQFKTVKANDRLNGYERTSSMAARNDTEGHRVVGALNGDFYLSGGVPVSMQIAEGHVLRREASGRPAIGFSPDNDVAIDVPVFSSSLILDDTTVTVNGVNEARGTDQLILYNKFFGPSTSTNQYGTEVRVRSLDGWVVNDTVRVVVDAKATSGNMSIGTETAVLSGHGTMAAVLNGTAVDDTLRLVVQAMPSVDELMELVSGGPFIVVDGVVDVGPRGDGGDRHPRTAIGINEDGTRVYMVTVDGRQAISRGMDLHELGALMVETGAHTAINLDGGGSTTMVVRGEVANSPSDTGGERSIANALLAVSSAPTGELSAVRLRQATIKLFRGSSYTFTASGIDEHFNPIPIETERLEFSADASIGEIDAEGRLVAATSADTGYVYVQYDDFRDSTLVIVKDIGSIAISPSAIVTDTIRTIGFGVTAFDTDNVRQNVDPTVFEWEVTDEALGEIDENGAFRGLASGTVGVVVSYRTMTDTSWVTVEVGEGEEVLSTFDSMTGWSVVREHVDADGSDASIHELDGENVLQLDYKYTLVSGGGPYRMMLTTNQAIFGVPDSIHVDVLSDGLRHRLIFEVQDATGSRFTVYGTSFATESEEFDRISAPVNRSGMVHPIRLRAVGVQLGNTGVINELNEGTLYLDNLRVGYPSGSAVGADEERSLPESYVLHQNYPNPFNPSTTIRYEVRDAGQLTLRVVNVLGQVVETLVEGDHARGTYEVTWDGSSGGASVASGMYFYVLEASGVRLARPMVLMK